jgi:hypothetical protein
MVLKRNYCMLRWHQAGQAPAQLLGARYTAHDPRVWVSQRLCVSISPPRALRLVRRVRCAARGRTSGRWDGGALRLAPGSGPRGAEEEREQRWGMILGN